MNSSNRPEELRAVAVLVTANPVFQRSSLFTPSGVTAVFVKMCPLSSSPITSGYPALSVAAVTVRTVTPGSGSAGLKSWSFLLDWTYSTTLSVVAFVVPYTTSLPPLVELVGGDVTAMVLRVPGIRLSAVQPVWASDAVCLRWKIAPLPLMPNSSIVPFRFGAAATWVKEPSSWVQGDQLSNARTPGAAGEVSESRPARTLRTRAVWSAPRICQRVHTLPS